MVKLREARSEREIGLFITTRIQEFEKKSNKTKKQVKLVTLLNVLFICLFQLYLSLVIEAFRISTNL